jgi:long-subunit fatty acid transport protein
MRIPSSLVKLLSAGALLLPAFSVHCQDRDFGWWSSIALQHRLTNRWELSLAEQVRTNRNLETVDLFFTQAGIQYDLAYRKKLKPLVIGIRARLQGRGEDLLVSRESAGPDWFFRARLGIQYDTGRRWTPHVSHETFVLLRSVTDPERNGDITRFRYSAGIEYEFNRHHALDVSYTLQHNRSPWLDEFIVSTGYAFSF